MTRRAPKSQKCLRHGIGPEVRPIESCQLSWRHSLLCKYESTIKTQIIWSPLNSDRSWRPRGLNPNLGVWNIICPTYKRPWIMNGIKCSTSQNDTALILLLHPHIRVKVKSFWLIFLVSPLERGNNQIALSQARVLKNEYLGIPLQRS